MVDRISNQASVAGCPRIEVEQMGEMLDNGEWVSIVAVEELGR